jgi:hypothetical protein
MSTLPETAQGTSSLLYASLILEHLDSDVWRRFIKGHSILIGIISLAFFLTIFMTTYLRFENARRDKLEQEAGTNYSDSEEQEHKEMADSVPWFRYTV